MRRLYFTLALFAVIIALCYIFPSVLQNNGALTGLIYLFIALFFLSGSRALRSRLITGIARDFAIWATIILVLVFAYSFRDELGRSRLMAELNPSGVHVSGDGTLSIRSAENGHFYVDGKVNGAAMRFLIDTGASSITLTPDDAKRAGFDPAKLEYTSYFSTANGQGLGASVTISSIEIGSIWLEEVPASVNKADMPESLLGMSFLKRLKGFRVEGSTLILVP